MIKQELLYDKILGHFGSASIFIFLIPLFWGLLKYKNFNISLRIFYFFVIAEFLNVLLIRLFSWATLKYIDFWQPFLVQFQIDSTNFFILFSYLSRFGILGYYFIITTKLVSKYALLKFFPLILLIVAFFDFFFITGYNNNSVLGQTLLDFYVIFFTLIQLWYIYRENSKVLLNRNPYFWINMGLLFPSVFSIWLSIFGTNLYEQDFILYCQVSIISIIFYCIGMLLIARGFYFARYAQYLPQHQVKTD